MDLEFKVGLSAFNKALDRIAQDQIPFATSLALNRTADALKAEIVREMQQVFDRPTPFTLNAFYIKRATKQKPVAYLSTKDESFKAQPPSKWLSPQILGGQRGLKRFEERLQQAGILPAGWAAVPAPGARRDAFGNVSRSQLVAILADAQAHWDPAQNSTAASRAKRGRRKKRGGQYFAIRTQTGRLRPGVYERIGFAFGSSVRPVLLFVPAVPTYSKRLRLQEIAEQVMRDRYPDEFAKALNQAVASAITRQAK